MTATSPPPLPLSVGLVTEAISAGTPQVLRFFLNNGGGAAIPWSSAAGTLSLTIPTGSAAGALTATGGLKNCSLTPVQTLTGQTWTITATATGFSLSPQGGTLLGTGSQGTVTFDLAGLAPVNPGVAQLQLSYKGSGTAAAGSVPLPVVVKSSLTPVINSFTASPDTIALPTGSATTETGTTLSFSVSNAAQVMILGAGYSAPAPAGVTTVTVTPVQTTTYMLVATSVSGAVATAQATVTVTPNMYDLLPAGMIAIWTGTVADIPAGWHLCDGSAAGIPDLRDRFVVGAGGTYSVPSSGPADGHTHPGTAVWAATGSGGGHNHILSCSASGDSVLPAACTVCSNHTHGGALEAGSTASNPGLRPEWIALGYVVKLS